jgi:hypothetical protein
MSDLITREDAELLNAERSEPRPQKYGVTYFCTDRHGNVYARYSARHGEPRYTWAAIGRLIGTTARVGKACVAYSSNRETVARVAARSVRNGHYDYTTRKQEPVEAEVVPVRAYRGRWTVGREPARQWALQGEVA